MSFDAEAFGRVISRTDPLVLDVGGVTLEVLTALDAVAGAPALLRGTMPGGAVVPLHAHADPETFYVLSGRMDGLVMSGGGAEWVTVSAGQIFHVPPNARHALRNSGADPNVALVVSTPQMAEFFARVGVELPSVDAPRRPMSAEEVGAFMAEADARGHWNASPEQNHAVGIDLPPPS